MMPFSSTQAKLKGLERNHLASCRIETIFSPCLTHVGKWEKEKNES